MTGTEEVMNTHATNLRDELASTETRLPPLMQSLMEEIRSHKGVETEEKDNTRYVVHANVENLHGTAFSNPLSKQEATNALWQLGKALNNPEVRAVMIGDFLVPVDRIHYVYVDENWEGEGGGGE